MNISSFLITNLFVTKQRKPFNHQNTFCLQPMAEGPSNYLGCCCSSSCSGHFINLLLGYTSGLNLATVYATFTLKMAFLKYKSIFLKAKKAGPFYQQKIFLNISNRPTLQAFSTIPLESCTLLPKQECRDVSVLVPSLVPVEKCIDVPKESCSKVVVPRKIQRVSTRLYCDLDQEKMISGEL